MEILNKGIWDILDHNKSNILDLTKYGYKQYFTVMQHIQNFTHNKYFCIEYNLYEGCSKSNCIKSSQKIEKFSPSINFNDEIWKDYNIENYLDALFSNLSSYCIKCQWKNDIPDKTFSPRYFKYFKDIIPSMFFIR